MTAPPSGTSRRASVGSRVLPAVFFAATAALSGCGDGPGGVPPSHASAPGGSVLSTVERGERLWIRHCGGCHGATGDGRTLAATRLDPKPRGLAGDPLARDRRAVHAAIVGGRPGSAMPAYAGLLSEADTWAIAGYVTGVVAPGSALPVRRHPGPAGADERAIAALASAGASETALAIASPLAETSAVIDGRWARATCTACHDRDSDDRSAVRWQLRALSFPRDAYCTSCHDEANGNGALHGGRRPAGHPPVAGESGEAASGPERSMDTSPATAGANDRETTGEPEPTGPARALRLHDRPPRLGQASPAIRRGEHLFQRNCAFCHAADGTGRSWFGRFIDPPPRDLTDARAMAGMTRARLRRAIEQGVDGSSMPAWRDVLPAGDIEAIAAYVDLAFIAPADSRVAARR